jgi:hypothetical protein
MGVLLLEPHPAVRKRAEIAARTENRRKTYLEQAKEFIDTPGYISYDASTRIVG